MLPVFFFFGDFQICSFRALHELYPAVNVRNLWQLVVVIVSAHSLVLPHEITTDE